MIHHIQQAFPTPQPARPRYLMIDGQPRHVRTESDLVDALTDALVDGAIRTGSACEADLIGAGFTRAELAQHLPKARDRAAQALRAKVV
ncbi:hypothetical protein FHP25_36030 [Vineibacter terrae]|uniref:Uncharacterized protein n=1 Tax=Vineibacter terrae TaxID=2586908 RepID=A0A5C8P9V6_9HYPH|nr:hypothetical protein [Vineibacter terrae]TXL70134.1 hypothetical protein FHP25_36030 [Vineibacter terrae]